MKVLVTAADQPVGNSFISLYGAKKDIVAIEKFDIDLSDIARVSDLIARHRPDVIVNADEMRDDFGKLGGSDRMIENYNVVCFKNLRTAAKTYNVKRLIVFGSGREYGLCQKAAKEEDLNDCRPLGSYAYSKHVVSRQAANDGITTVLRLFDTFGKGCYSDGIVMSFISKVVQNEQIKFEKNQKFSTIYIDDLAAVVNKAVTGDIPCGDYNVATHDYTTSEIIKLIKKVCYKFIPVKFEDENGFDNTYTADCTKLAPFIEDIRPMPAMLALGRTLKV